MAQHRVASAQHAAASALELLRTLKIDVDFFYLDDDEYAKRIKVYTDAQLIKQDVDKLRQMYSNYMKAGKGISTAFLTFGMSTGYALRKVIVAKRKLKVIHKELKSRGVAPHKATKMDVAMSQWGGLVSCCIGAYPGVEDELNKPDSEVEPDVEPAVEPDAEPAVEPAVEPDAEPAVEPAVEPDAEPAVEPDAEPAVEPVVEPDAEPDVVDEHGVSTDVEKLPGAIDKHSNLIVGVMATVHHEHRVKSQYRDQQAEKTEIAEDAQADLKAQLDSSPAPGEVAGQQPGLDPVEQGDAPEAAGASVDATCTVGTKEISKERIGTEESSTGVSGKEETMHVA